MKKQRVGRAALTAWAVLTAAALAGPARGVEAPATSAAATAASAPATAPSLAWDAVANLPEAALDAAHRAKAQVLMDRAGKYLLRQREEDGSWSMGRGGSAPITAMVLTALVQHPGYDVKNPAVKKGYEVLLSFKQPDGGVYSPKEGSSGYTSAVALMALSAAHDPEFAGPVRELVAYLKGLQIVPGAESSDGQKVKDDDPRVGGVSYGSGPGRPDLSNVGMWAQALHEAGVPADDPSLKRAVAFISRLQNRSESNTMAWAKDGANDGGFIYAFPNEKSADARSYGSMTYTGFKSLLYAGVSRDDPRVTAAFRWIRQYWRLDSNPNMPEAESKAGLFYYYHAFAKAMRAWGEPVVTDLKGGKHNWRHEVIDALAERVRQDGSWVNESRRWWENSPVLVTCYAMLALEEATRATSPARGGKDAK